MDWLHYGLILIIFVLLGIIALLFNKANYHETLSTNLLGIIHRMNKDSK